VYCQVAVLITEGFDVSVSLADKGPQLISGEMQGFLKVCL
jgi:hypothetical protein